MQQDRLNNIRVEYEEVLNTPQAVKTQLPLNETNSDFIHQSRLSIENILDRKDDRFLLVTGPCSIHDIKAAKDYALRLKALHDQYSEKLFIVMRVYFEKPRTTIGWKGFLNDPNLNDSFDVANGIQKGRELLLWLADLGLPAGTEALDPISPQYLGDLFSWAAIGARTTESQTHREMASGLSMPIGFKNGTDGNLNVAINAMQSSASPHRFMGINQNGQVSLIHTKGNPYGHIILRGGKEPNYEPESIARALRKVEDAGVKGNFVVDCSHGNSSKDYTKQPDVFRNVIAQVKAGNRNIVGAMLESHIKAGNQKLTENIEDLAYGVSITDGCIDWETTETLLAEAFATL
ncbi:MAG: 3-deoxy-7-phosphoheptulonate synthase [Pseudomonadota bacterium]